MSATLSELAHTEALHFERLATLGTLAAGLAHEIGTPLATVLTNLDVVLERLGELDVPADEIRPLVGRCVGCAWADRDPRSHIAPSG